MVTVENATNRVTIDGFEITGGRANGLVFPANSGGGILARNSLVTLRDLKVIDNLAVVRGGGVAVVGNVAPDFVFFENCLFEENRSNLVGGGLFCDTNFQMDRSEFSRNSARNAGGGFQNENTEISLVFDTRFAFNTAGDDADDPGFGGAYNVIANQGQTRTQRCTFIRNVGSSVGGMRVRGGFHEVLQSGFYSNETVLFGLSQASALGFLEGTGGTLIVDSCLFSGNDRKQGSIVNNGATITNDRAGSSLLINNSTIVNNISSSAPGGGRFLAGDTSITASIFWSNFSFGLAGQLAQFDTDTAGGATISANQSIVQDLGLFFVAPPGTGNSDADPMFVDADGGNNIAGDLDDNVMLMPGSPAIDAGNALAVNVNVSFDFYGAPRFANDPGSPDTGVPDFPGNFSDIGAAEFQDTTPTPCPADINMDGELNGADFNAWLAAFSAGDPIADQNQDGNLNGADFNAWLANFTTGCP